MRRLVRLHHAAAAALVCLARASPLFELVREDIVAPIAKGDQDARRRAVEVARGPPVAPAVSGALLEDDDGSLLWV